MGVLWNGILDALGAILAFFYAIIPSYGLAIVGLTILVRLALFPLTAKQARSMLAMQQLQPEIKKLQAKYKGDRQRLNEETMALYKEAKVNPLSGCLPLLAQAPIFFALFRILRNPFQHIPEGSALFKAFCGGVGAESCNPVGLDFLGVNLSLSAQDPHGSFVASLPYLFLVILVGLSGYVQSRQSMRYQAQANPQTQMIGRLMPVIFMFISLSLPAGVVLYFLVSNVWQLGQQEIIFRRADREPGPVKTPPRKPDKAEERPAEKAKAEVATTEKKTRSSEGASGSAKRSRASRSQGSSSGAGDKNDKKRRPTTGPPRKRRKR